MDDAFLMRGFESLRNLLGDAERLIDGYRPAGDALIEALAINEFEDQELRAVDLFEAVNLRDVWMVERGEHLRFATEPGDAFGIVRERGGQDLQRDVTTELGVLRAVDLAHATGTDGSDDFERAQLRSWYERHYGVPV